MNALWWYLMIPVFAIGIIAYGLAGGSESESAAGAAAVAMIVTLVLRIFWNAERLWFVITVLSAMLAIGFLLEDDHVGTSDPSTADEIVDSPAEAPREDD